MWSTIPGQKPSSILFLISLAALVFFPSCDPARVLVIKAAAKPGVSATIYGNSGLLPDSGGKPAEKISIRVAADLPANRDTIIYYGFGGWSGNEKIKDFARNIDSIIINNSNGKVVLNTQTGIIEYLLQQRHGFAKRILRIKAN